MTKGSPTLKASLGFWSWSWSSAVSPQVIKAINQEVGCHYFLQGPRLPLTSPTKLYWWQRYMCKQLAKGCTRQHGSRDSNLRPADCKLSSLTTWSPSHTLVNHINKIQTGLLTEQESGTDGTGDICGYCGLRPAASDKMCRHRRGWEILWNLAEASTTFGFCLTRDHSRLGQVPECLANENLWKLQVRDFRTDALPVTQPTVSKQWTITAIYLTGSK